MRVWQRLLDGLDRHGSVAMATIVGTQGSAPREAGARMVVMPDGSFFGTIGGGTLEWRIIAELQAALTEGRNADRYAQRSIALGPELGQCCGGRVDIALELFDGSRRGEAVALAEAEAAGSFRTRAIRHGGEPLVRTIDPDGGVAIGEARQNGSLLEEGFGEDRRRLYLFGAGHVGRALVLALAPLPFEVFWIDPRPDAFPSHVPANSRCLQPDDPASLLKDAPHESFVLVMTHSHALDLAIVHAGLANERLGYVGVIGSATKRARFTKRLAEAGLPRETIGKLHSPIGIAGISSKHPAVIAASVASDLLIRDEATRRVSLPQLGPRAVVSLHSSRGN